jgi:hypothetical protein
MDHDHVSLGLVPRNPSATIDNLRLGQHDICPSLHRAFYAARYRPLEGNLDFANVRGDGDILLLGYLYDSLIQTQQKHPTTPPSFPSDSAHMASLLRCAKSVDNAISRGCLACIALPVRNHKNESGLVISSSSELFPPFPRLIYFTLVPYPSLLDWTLNTNCRNGSHCQGMSACHVFNRLTPGIGSILQVETI